MEASVQKDHSRCPLGADRVVPLPGETWARPFFRIRESLKGKNCKVDVTALFDQTLVWCVYDTYTQIRIRNESKPVVLNQRQFMEKFFVVTAGGRRAPASTGYRIRTSLTILWYPGQPSPPAARHHPKQLSGPKCQQCRDWETLLYVISLYLAKGQWISVELESSK